MTYLEIKLFACLRELLEEIDCLDSVSFSRDLEPHKAEAIWEYSLQRARNLVRQVDREVKAETHVAKGRKLLEELTPTPPPHADGNPF